MRNSHESYLEGKTHEKILVICDAMLPEILGFRRGEWTPLMKLLRRHSSGLQQYCMNDQSYKSIGRQ